MSTVLFCVTEGFNGLRRSKASGILSIITISFSLYLIGVFYSATENLYTIIQELKSRVTFEVFLQDEASLAEQRRIERTMRRYPAVESLKFVGKDEALELFKKTFGAEFGDLIEDNPLPASFEVFLKPKYVHFDSVQALAQKIEGVPGVDNVVYRRQMLEVLDVYFKNTIAALVVVGVALGLISFILVSNNIRLTILARKRIIDTMQLVGATRGLVRWPLVIQGVLEGVVGGALAGFYLWLTGETAQTLISPIVQIPPSIYWGMILTGIFYGSLGSLHALRGKL